MNNQLDESELENVVGGYRNQIINGKEFTGAIRGRCLMIGRCYYATSNDRDVWAYGRILDRDGTSRNAFNYGDVKKCEYTMQIMFTSDESVIPQWVMKSVTYLANFPKISIQVFLSAPLGCDIFFIFHSLLPPFWKQLSAYNLYTNHLKQMATPGTFSNYNPL